MFRAVPLMSFLWKSVTKKTLSLYYGGPEPSQTSHCSHKVQLYAQFFLNIMVRLGFFAPITVFACLILNESWIHCGGKWDDWWPEKMVDDFDPCCCEQLILSEVNDKKNLSSNFQKLWLYAFDVILRETLKQFHLTAQNELRLLFIGMKRWHQRNR